MAARMNHARLAHRGRATEAANPSIPSWARGKHVPAKAANAGRSLTAEERDAHLARLGITITSAR